MTKIKKALIDIYGKEFVDSLEPPKRPRYRLTRCWLVEYIDDDGKEIDHEYIFAKNKKEAIEQIEMWR